MERATIVVFGKHTPDHLEENDGKMMRNVWVHNHIEISELSTIGVVIEIHENSRDVVLTFWIHGPPLSWEVFEPLT